MLVSYAGHASFTEIDESERHLVLDASGTDTRGAGSVRAELNLRLAPAGDNTRCDVRTSLDVTGKAAQFGGGLLRGVSARLVSQFAESLAAKVGRGHQDSPTDASSSVQPLDGLALLRSGVTRQLLFVGAVGLAGAAVLVRMMLRRR